jgi:hypothetical protein
MRNIAEQKGCRYKTSLVIFRLHSLCHQFGRYHRLPKRIEDDYKVEPVGGVFAKQKDKSDKNAKMVPIIHNNNIYNSASFGL